MEINPIYFTDGYKLPHHLMFPPNTTKVYDNITARSFKHALPGTTHSVYVGGSLVWKELKDTFDKEFFSKPKAEILADIREELSLYSNAPYNVDHFAALHDLGYLPLRIKALPEGSLVPVRIPMMTLTNTLPPFYWLPNYLESVISNKMWMPVNSATIAYQFRKLLTKWVMKTDKTNIAFIKFQAHDFAMRGMAGIESSYLSGIGHAALFEGSDNIPTIKAIRYAYGDKGFLIGGVPATEHSVMCAGEKDSEIETFRRLLKLYPTGILSIVSDTWDLWKVCTTMLTELKEEVLARDGKLVIRPDSGNPVDIICGYHKSDTSGQQSSGWREYSSFYPEGLRKYETEASYKGVIELLWDIFGGTINDQGYKVLDSHIGAIYGDSITLDRAEQICQRLSDKGFASTNIVLGIGSYTYQYNTRDTLGIAMKATYTERYEDGKLIKLNIFKDPITDNGIKKSARGLLQVYRLKGAHGYSEYQLKEDCTEEEEQGGDLQIIFEDGKLFNQISFQQVRAVIDNNFKNGL